MVINKKNFFNAKVKGGCGCSNGSKQGRGFVTSDINIFRIGEMLEKFKSKINNKKRKITKAYNC